MCGLSPFFRIILTQASGDSPDPRFTRFGVAQRWQTGLACLMDKYCFLDIFHNVEKVKSEIEPIGTLIILLLRLVHYQITL
ncbi:unnamed protein product [Phytomonas sp. Hart1]|nr:unnamed protein product [Phytomonas sp. Hart1]|eukprot:CCW66536.1 unnamed protein product [Phytomonas sp. isolate Hart1]